MLSLSHTALSATGYHEMDPDKSAKAQKPQRSERWKK